MWEQYRLGPTIATLMGGCSCEYFCRVPEPSQRSESRYAEEAGKLTEVDPDGRAKRSVKSQQELATRPGICPSAPCGRSRANGRSSLAPSPFRCWLRS